MRQSAWRSVFWFSIFTLGALVLGSLFVPDALADNFFVQTNAQNFSSATGTLDFGSNTTPGDLILVGFYFAPPASLVSVTDSQRNSYQQIGSTISSPSGKQKAALFYAKNISGGPVEVTVTLSEVPEYPGLAVYLFEYRGIDKVAPLHGSAQASGPLPGVSRSAARDVSSGPITTAAPGDLLFGFCVSDEACRPRDGFIARSKYENNLGEDKIADSAGSGVVTATATGSWTLHAAAFKTRSGDITAPSVPTGLEASVISISQINLSWNKSTDGKGKDSSGVAGYRVFRNGRQIAQVTGTAYSNTGLDPATTYSYSVAAFDAAGNVSSQTAPVSATTVPDTSPPSITLTSPLPNATVSGTIAVSADASDNVGVAGVQFFIDGAKLGGEDTSPPFSVLLDTTTLKDGVHQVSAQARDAAMNLATATPVSITVSNPITTADPFSIDPAPALRFGTHEVVLTGDGSVANPFNTVGNVKFTPPSGAANAVTVRAFFDGANTWRARVYVTEGGTWQWISDSASDGGLNGKSGSFLAIASTLPGLLKRDSVNPKSLRTADGHWFAPISDTAWLLMSRDPVVTQNWKQFVQDDAAHGINVLGPVGSLEAWGTGDVNHQGNNEPWLDDGSFDRTRYELPKFQNADSRLIWIFNNYPGIYIQSMLLGTQIQNWWTDLDPSIRANTLDYLIARWSAFPNLFWLVSEDQEVRLPKTLDFNRDVGNYYALHEPWRHLMSTQPSRDLGFPFTTVSDLNWVGYISLQVTDPLGANQMADFTSVPRHVMMGESYYEQDYGSPPSNLYDPRFYFRWSMWSWFLAGGSSNYGGRYGVIHPYSQTSRPDLVWIGPGANFTGYQLHGLDSMAYVWPYFQTRGIDLSLFKPNDALVTDWARRAGDTWKPKLMQRGTQEFLVYNPNAYSEAQYSATDPQAASMTIDLTTAAGTFNVEWYRPYDGLAQNGGTVTGGAPRLFTSPWTGSELGKGYDVVLLLTLTTP